MTVLPTAAATPLSSSTAACSCAAFNDVATRVASVAIASSTDWVRSRSAATAGRNALEREKRSLVSRIVKRKAFVRGVSVPSAETSWLRCTSATAATSLSTSMSTLRATFFANDIAALSAESPPTHPTFDQNHASLSGLHALV